MRIFFTPFRLYWNALRRFDDFSGRSGRGEYIVFTFINMLILALLKVAMVQLVAQGEQQTAEGVAIGTLGFAIVMTLPGVAVVVRRLHDMGLRAWWAIAALIPYAGLALLALLVFVPSIPQENIYGPIPGQKPGLLPPLRRTGPWWRKI